MKCRAVVEQDESGKFVASCPTLPGCHTQGDTHKKAMENIREAIEAHLEDLQKHGDPVPPPLSEEVVGVPMRRKAV